MFKMPSIPRPFRHCTRMAGYATDRPRPTVSLSQGVVSGIQRRLPNRGWFHCFQGIPYAEPPIGELRFEVYQQSSRSCQFIKLIFLNFQPPRPLLKFKEDVLDCSKERSVCFHTDILTKKRIGSEDCLHLNVYRPDEVDSNAPLPVMIWFHGGAFIFGSGNSE